MQYALLLQAINDGVGLVVHSLLLVPYYSWKHSHRRHHSNTGSLAKDEVGRGDVCVEGASAIRAMLEVRMMSLQWAPGCELG